MQKATDKVPDSRVRVLNMQLWAIIRQWARGPVVSSNNNQARHALGQCFLVEHFLLMDQGPASSTKRVYSGTHLLASPHLYPETRVPIAAGFVGSCQKRVPLISVPDCHQKRMIIEFVRSTSFMSYYLPGMTV